MEFEGGIAGHQSIIIFLVFVSNPTLIKCGRCSVLQRRASLYQLDTVHNSRSHFLLQFLINNQDVFRSVPLQCNEEVLTGDVSPVTRQLNIIVLSEMTQSPLCGLFPIVNVQMSSISQFQMFISSCDAPCGVHGVGSSSFPLYTKFQERSSIETASYQKNLLLCGTDNHAKASLNSIIVTSSSQGQSLLHFKSQTLSNIPLH